MIVKTFLNLTLLSFIILLLTSSSCDKNTTTATEPSTLEMEMLSYDFEGDFDDMWNKVDSLQKIGLYKSALNIVSVIFDSASVAKNAPQVVKSVIHKMKYNSYITEDEYVVALDELNKISKESTFPLKQIIHSVTAETYWGYYQINRWKFINRTQTINFDNDDIRTWDLTTLAEKVYNQHQLAISNKDSLQHTDIRDFDQMLTTYVDDNEQRPTLYDFLAHRALDFFQNPERNLTRPADQFTLDGKEYFSSGDIFSKINTESSDSLSNEIYEIRILQELTKFHLTDEKPTALIDLELRRLKFARANSTETNKEELYLIALNKLSEKYNTWEANDEIQFFIADYHNEQGNKYNSETKENQWEKKKAYEICSAVMDKNPNSYGAGLCKSLLKQIRIKSISFSTEPGYQPNTIGKFSLSTKNVDSLYFRIIKIDWNYFLTENKYGEELINSFIQEEAVKSWSKQIKNFGDFQLHSTELKLASLPKGQYVILASPDKNFEVKNNAIAYSSFWSSNLSYIYRKNEDETLDVTVLDRETGAPIKGAQVQLYTRKYNRSTRKYDINKEENYTANENGRLKIESAEKYRYLYLDVTHKDDRYNTTSQLYQYKPYDRSPRANTTTHFFTDRAIYRPGQTVYFKGIKIYHDDDKHTLEKAKTSTVEFIDANYQKIADLKLTTNEYGTFSGSFTAPIGMLNGQMHIRDAHGSKYFRVEEYKRPKFEVDFEPIEGVYKIGQEIKVTGTAKAYAGANIDGAEVQYRVTRSASFPYWTRHRWGYSPNSQEIETTNGVSKTDENGEFIISFNADEDKSIEKKYFPTYSYTIHADVTDINGETHSNSQWVMVGYNAMNLSIGITNQFDRKSQNKFIVKTTNLNGEKIKASGNIIVHKLEEPSKVFRTSLWGRPDHQEFSKKEFYDLFPNDVYEKENDVTTFKKEKEVLNIPFNTETSDSAEFNGMKNWTSGRYVLEASSIDAFGEEVKDIQYFTLYDNNSTKNPTNETWWFTPVKSYAEPGENAVFLIATGDENLKVLYEIEHIGKIVQKEWFNLSKEQKKITIPVLEKHRGNFTIHFSLVKHGRVFTRSETITVPYSNKTLDIEFETFRNKLLPGQKEEWKMLIKGPKGEKVAAEMLATMYDASLDAFASNAFYMNIYNSYYSNKHWTNNSFNTKNSQLYENDWNEHSQMIFRNYDQLNWFGYSVNYYSYKYRSLSNSAVRDDNMFYEEDSEIEESSVSTVNDAPNKAAPPVVGAMTDAIAVGNTESIATDNPNSLGGKKKEDAAKDSHGSTYDGSTNRDQDGLGNIKARTNLNETAFFLPQLETNEAGEIIIKFTIPEALTKWKFMAMAHTKDLKVGYITEEVVTQKKLMVIPNAPRFMREGDKMTFTAKVSNLAEKDLSGNAQLLLFNSITMKPIDALFNNDNAVIPFTIKKGQSARLAWDIVIPEGVGAVTYRVVAKAENFTDGEEMALPILTNRMLVTESMPLPSKGIGTKDFKFTKLINSSGSSTLKHHKLTLEYTSNPAWYAIQAMPYMMEYPYDCAEQTFTRYYSNSLASSIVNSSPKIKAVFDNWKQQSPAAFMSNLEKNKELKSLLLQETPWVLNSQDEGERKKRVALLFDLNKMDNELTKAMRKLQKAQVSNGGWPWFPGMPESRYITQHIITGMGHLDNLGVKNVRENADVWKMVKKGVGYLDARLLEDYEWTKKHYPNSMNEQHIGQLQIQYLYARSYFKDLPMNSKLKEAVAYYQEQAKKYWMKFSIYTEGMIALEAHRFGIEKLPQQVLASIKERSILHEELGMYWKDNVGGYYWYQAPIETQALLIEAFDEVNNDETAVEDMKVWLLKQKQTTDWKTTKATAEACYALLLRGTELLTNDEMVEIKVAEKVIDPIAMGAEIEAGTGYFKTSWGVGDIKPEMGNVSVTRKTKGVSWGAMYWQYFEDLDKITPHETPLELDKKLFLVKNTDSGPVMTPITESTKLKPGDKVRVRVELRTDRDLEYVHMKDMRASSFEPVNVISRYRYQDGLGYYESTKDASTNFFMDMVRKGTYVFEYDLRVSHYGDFSNGITTIQCMYAPEFTSHSEGIRVKIEE